MNSAEEQLASILNGYAAISQIPNHHDTSLELAIKQIKTLFGYEEVKTLEERRSNFIETIRPYVESTELSKQDANEFTNYWLEINSKGRKFRFEKEKSWSLERRLTTWMKNKQKFSIANILRK